MGDVFFKNGQDGRVECFITFPTGSLAKKLLRSSFSSIIACDLHGETRNGRLNPALDKLNETNVSSLNISYTAFFFLFMTCNPAFDD